MKPSKLKPVDPPTAGSVDKVEEGFVSMISTHQTALLAFLLSMVPNRSDAEDILQRTNVVLWRKRETFQVGTNFRAWAFTVARWESRAFLQERKRKSWLVYDDEVARIVGDRMASVSSRSMEGMSGALGRCLSKLSAKNRALIVERYQDGLSFREAGERWNRSEGGLRVTLHRIRTTLRKCIAREIKGERP